MAQYTSYYLYQKFEKRDGQDYIPVYPNIYSIDGDGTQPKVIRKENDEECGYIPPSDPIYRWKVSGYICDNCPEYRWITIDPSIDYYCSGTTKYYKQKEQVSYDEGSTWEDVYPAEYRWGSSAETHSTDCGYEECDCDYLEPIDYSRQYLTFIPSENSTFQYMLGILSYSLDNGSTWISLSQSTNTPTISAGQKIMWKNTSTPYTHVGMFSSSGNFIVEGNPMSLIYGDNFIGQTSLSGKEDVLGYLFGGCTGLTSAENMVLPATTLAYACYSQMFSGCTSLTTAPQILPATTLADDCYNSMFSDCTNLTKAPEISATIMGEYSCSEMFAGCTSLTTAPDLSATTLAEGCCGGMFYGCTSLTSAPTLSATTLANYCYEFMFYNCTSLTTAPVLPALTLAQSCYIEMFLGCSSLNYVKCLATNVSANSCLSNWLSGVSSTGTFVKNSSMSNWPSGVNGIPTNWTVQNA